MQYGALDAVLEANSLLNDPSVYIKYSGIIPVSRFISSMNEAWMGQHGEPIPLFAKHGISSVSEFLEILVARNTLDPRFFEFYRVYQTLKNTTFGIKD